MEQTASSTWPLQSLFQRALERLQPREKHPAPAAHAEALPPVPTIWPEGFDPDNLNRVLREDMPDLKRQAVGLLAMTRHPLFLDYVAFFEEKYGEHPVISAYDALIFQLETGAYETAPPPTGLLLAQHGRVWDRTTAVSFQEWQASQIEPRPEGA